MIKILSGVLVVLIVALIGFVRFAPGPQSAKDSIERAVSQVKSTNNLGPEQEALLKIQLALSDYMARNGQAPDSLKQLVPQYFESEPLNPVTGKAFEYKRIGRSPKLGAQAVQGATNASQPDLAKMFGDAAGFVNPNTIIPEDYQYDPTDKRDPFTAYTPQADASPDDGTPLTKYSIGQLRVAAIMTGPDGEKKAIVEDQQGRGYNVGIDTVVGSELGVISLIDEKAVTLVVTKKDFAGNEKEEVVVMELNRSAPSGQRKGPNQSKRKKR
jgi:Tfp pilus assembly protein PilP